MRKSALHAGRRFGHRHQDLHAEINVSQSTLVVTRHMLDDRQVQDLDGVLASTAGLKITDHPGGPGAPYIYLRGFRTIDLIGIYRDGPRGGFNA